MIHFDEWNVSSHITEYRVKGPDDFKVLQYLLEDEEWYWDDALFQKDMETYGAYGAPQFYFRRSPVQRLLIEEMGIQDAHLFHERTIQRFWSPLSTTPRPTTTPCMTLYATARSRSSTSAKTSDGSIDSPRSIWAQTSHPLLQQAY